MDAENNALLEIYAVLQAHYGTQAWWPADDHFEIMVGAILTQNTAWTNVEKAIANLKARGACNPREISSMALDDLATLIRPSGYYNQKAVRLQGFASWYLQQGEFEALAGRPAAQLRDALLALHGIGDETADDIVLYAFHQPSFVIDAYTRRLFMRLGWVSGDESYAGLQALFHAGLPPDVDLFQQYHALIVAHAKYHCMKRPACSRCPLLAQCHYEETSN